MKSNFRRLSISEEIATARETVYTETCGHLNRAQRRSSGGKVLVMEAKVKALEAENTILRDRLAELGYRV
jgi:hypothetical protein